MRKEYRYITKFHAAPPFPPDPKPVQVGERRMESPCFGGDRTEPPLPCTVLRVNEKHRYYTVRFDKLGFCQSFKY